MKYDASIRPDLTSAEAVCNLMKRGADPQSNGIIPFFASFGNGFSAEIRFHEDTACCDMILLDLKGDAVVRSTPEHRLFGRWRVRYGSDEYSVIMAEA